jgi:23S rRNA (uracil1939-C5)-methyltransferase
VRHAAPSTRDVRLVTIERIVGEGRGIGYLDDATMFVPLTAPGDVVHAQVARKQGKVLHGELLEVVVPSPMRVEPRIEDPAQSGGADLQHIAYEHQLTIKAGIIEDSLRRIARLPEIPEIVVTPSPNEWHYRSRAEFQVDHETGRVGYFAPGSHHVVDIAESPVLAPAVQDQLTALRDDMAAGIVPKRAKEYRAVAGDLGSVLEPTATHRSRLVQTEVGGYRFGYAAECFFQANVPIAEAMLADVLRIGEIAREAPGIAIDLYCGVGFFTVPLSKRFPRVIGVENHQTAIRYAEENLQNAGQKNGRFVTAPVERWLAGDRSPLGRVALCVFDPLRTGAGPQVIEHMVRLNPAHIAAVSCDPATFSRDLRGLLDGGYELRSIRGFDMFPQTHHVEIVAHLERGER